MNITLGDVGIRGLRLLRVIELMHEKSKQATKFFTFNSGAMSTNVTVVMNRLFIAYANELRAFLSFKSFYPRC